MIFGKILKKYGPRKIAIDVGTHSLKGVVFEVIIGKNPIVLDRKTVKSPVFPDTDKPTPDEYVGWIVKKLPDFIQEMIKSSEHHPDTITIGLGPDIVALNIENWSARFSGSSQNDGAFYNQFAKILQENKKKHPEIIDAFLLDSYLNGYPLRHTATTFPPNTEFSFKTMVMRPASPRATERRASQEIATTLDMVKKGLSGLKIYFYPSFLAQKEVLTKVLEIHNSLVIDIGGETTAVTLLKNGSLEHVNFFPLGGRHFLRGISKIASISFEEAEDLKRQYSQGIVSQDTQKQLHNFIRCEAEIWKKMFIKILENFYHFGPLPPQVIIIGGGANMPEVNSVIRGNWIKNFSYVEYPKVNILRGDSVFSGDSLGGALQGPEDFNLAALIYKDSHQ